MSEVKLRTKDSIDDLKQEIKKNPELVEEIIKDNPEIMGVMMSKTICSIHQGPLPSAEELKKYSDIDKTFPDRLMTMVEEQASHRQNLELKVVHSGIKSEKLGTIFGFFIALLGLLSGVFLVYNEKQFSGFAFFITAMGSLVGVFLKNNNNQTSKIENKDQEMLENNPEEVENIEN